MNSVLTIREFAKAVRYSPSYVYQLIEEGRVNCIRIGGRRTIRIPSSEVDRYLSAKGVSADAEKD